ncbi:hypothetical protein HF670_08050 [Acidithiobacillus thiooxidans]|jgi:hypothetical protein|uniref:hypothetical protein n=1 Tax=Acidithiobacillus thiooxidans TaxID=930 RepID=UPI001C06DB1F|nr:hypothetical protein [Acidithiobacillus thiooxidans]MBU2839514.1 hypothetical protein [Acidithiobacillus thiooxidans]MBU2841868.1 hypothetical protein [Acidithiobacillus thiooxidans]
MTEYKAKRGVARMIPYFHTIRFLRQLKLSWAEILPHLKSAGVVSDRASQRSIANTFRSLEKMEALLASEQFLAQQKILPGMPDFRVMYDHHSQKTSQKERSEPLQSPVQSPVKNSRPLPGVRKIGEGTDEEKFARLRAMGIDTSSLEKE